MRSIATIATAAVALLVGAADIPEGVDPWQPWAFVVAVLAAASLASRHRSRPVGVVVSLVATIVLAVGAHLSGEAGQVPFGLLVVLGLLLADTALSAPVTTVTAVTALAASTGVAAEGLADERNASDVAFVLVSWALGVAVALSVRWRRLADEARDQRVRTLERERIARDLHDVVAHHVSAISLTAEGARGLVGRDDDAVRSSLGSIHTASATTLDEMRRMVAILRTDETQTSPIRMRDLQAALADGDTRGVEIVVTMGETVGEPPAGVTTAIVRIAREAVTNTRRHSPSAGTVRVEVDRRGDSIDLVVTDDGDLRRARSSSGPGFGLDGMRERAELLGGTCEAGPGPSGGWVVRARLPVGGRS